MTNQTKINQTKKDYYKRASSLMLKAYKEAIEKDHEFSEHTVIMTVNTEKSVCLDIKYTAIWAVKYWSHTILHSSWKYYRASLIYMAELFHEKGKLSEEQLNKVRALLKKTKGMTKNKIETRTSSNKKKSINLKEIKSIDNSLKDSNNKWANPLRLWIRAGKLTGLRPSEWKSCKYYKETNELVVKNAKNTNGRALGEYRTINLNHLDEEQVKDIVMHLQISSHMNKNKIWDKYYKGCSNLLRYISRSLWRNKDRYPTLYSCRHQFSADMKATGCSKKEVAALMGHASDLTAQEHYGRKIHGSRGRKPKVNKNDLARVRSSDKPIFKFEK